MSPQSIVDSTDRYTSLTIWSSLTNEIERKAEDFEEQQVKANNNEQIDAPTKQSPKKRNRKKKKSKNNNLNQSTENNVASRKQGA